MNAFGCGTQFKFPMCQFPVNQVWSPISLYLLLSLCLSVCLSVCLNSYSIRYGHRRAGGLCCTASATMGRMGRSLLAVSQSAWSNHRQSWTAAAPTRKSHDRRYTVRRASRENRPSSQRLGTMYHNWRSRTDCEGCGTVVLLDVWT